MDGGEKFSLTNNIDILRNFKWYDKINKPSLLMRGATFDKLVVPITERLLQVPVNTIDEHLDIKCYYSLHFTSTIL